MGAHPTNQDAALFELQDGLQVRRTGVTHRPADYAEQHFPVLQRMQQEHFWYRGRHRFLLAALQRQLTTAGRSPDQLCALDLGAGCGGWGRYLSSHLRPGFRELALADSSPCALAVAAAVAGPDCTRYQVDLRDLGWQNRWDIIFLLDVLEHVGDQQAVLRQIHDSLASGGLLLMTVPALHFFWSINDELAGHHRRYAKKDLQELAAGAGLRLCEARYFMFFLSPLLLAARAGRRAEGMSPAERERRTAVTHRIPPAPLNGLLSAVFAAETPLGLWWNFPWGTSLLGVFQKP
jgi:SAM-dependent methyltransferase